jgi:hypothetical protein
LLQFFYPSNPTSPFLVDAYGGLGRISKRDANGNLWDF